jgi:hypothetical protein
MLLHVLTGCCIGNALDLYSGGAGFESQPGHRLSWQRFFCGFPQSLQVNAGTFRWSGHDPSLPNPFQFICHPTMWWYIVSILKVLWNNPWHVAVIFRQPQLNFTWTAGSIFSLYPFSQWTVNIWYKPQHILCITYSFSAIQLWLKHSIKNHIHLIKHDTMYFILLYHIIYNNVLLFYADCLWDLMCMANVYFHLFLSWPFFP